MGCIHTGGVLGLTCRPRLMGTHSRLLSPRLCHRSARGRAGHGTHVENGESEKEEFGEYEAAELRL